MYISELMTMSQVIVNNIPVFIVMGLMIYWLNGKIESHLKENREMWMATNQRIDAQAARTDAILDILMINAGLRKPPEKKLH